MAILWGRICTKPIASFDSAVVLLSFAAAQSPNTRLVPGGRGGPPLPFTIQRLDPALDALIVPETKLETIVTIPNLSSEGPMWREGKLWLSDQRGGSVYMVTLDGKAEEFIKLAGGPVDPEARVNQGPNGQAAYKNGLPPGSARYRHSP